MTRVPNEKLMVFISNYRCFKQFFGIELTIQKAKRFPQLSFGRQFAAEWTLSSYSYVVLGQVIPVSLGKILPFAYGYYTDIIKYYMSKYKIFITAAGYMIPVI